ncbi:MAG: SCO family protein [Sphingomonadaceae bacterium]|nr:SCO family protein [Sphingomonadaceae bacterium]
MQTMNTQRRTPRFLPLFAAAVIALALLAGWYYWRQRAAAPPRNAPGMALAGADIGGPFSLVDQNGRTFTDKDLRGRYALIHFGYSFCPDVCPTDLQRMTQALAAFERSDPRHAAKVQPVFVTIDPERDTPRALANYAKNFHPRLVALTGSPAAITAMEKSYRVYAAKVVPEKGQDYLMNHSDVTYLFGPDGRPLAGMDSKASAAEMAAMLKAYVR